VASIDIWECETSALDGLEKRLRQFFGSEAARAAVYEAPPILA